MIPKWGSQLSKKVRENIATEKNNYQKHLQEIETAKKAVRDIVIEAEHTEQRGVKLEKTLEELNASGAGIVLNIEGEN